MVGKGVDCGIHNYKDAIFEELHMCLLAGSGNGGIYWVPVPSPHDCNDLRKCSESGPARFNRLILEGLEEHGPFCQQDCEGEAVRKKMAQRIFHFSSGKQVLRKRTWMFVNPDLKY